MQLLKKTSLVQTLLSFVLFWGFLEVGAYAQTRIEVTPMITVSETYDDNIFLTKNNKVSDFITVVTPGIVLGLHQEHTDLQLRYAPSFYWYADRSDLNYTAQSAGFIYAIILMIIAAVSWRSVRRIIQCHL